jgi:acyl-CoA thioesterase I
MNLFDMMKHSYLAILLSILLSPYSNYSQSDAKVSSAKDSPYLAPVIAALQKEWPNNPTVNLVFHGHSVPAGYFQTPAINTFQSYPLLVLKELTIKFPTVPINCIRTAIGGEHSKTGAKRFKEVLNHKPDVLFIDYALNDRAIGLVEAKKAWTKMIRMALKKKIKIILLSPSPDLTEDILNPNSELKKHRDQIQSLAKEYGIGFSDAFTAFQQIAASGEALKSYMAQSNHPNEKGHTVMSSEILRYFVIE